jgi:hypothetical protein
MKLIDSIPFLVDTTTIASLYEKVGLDKESDGIAIYMKDLIDLDSEIYSFDDNETGDFMEFEKDRIKYVQFFPISMAAELIEWDLDLKNRGYSNLDIAKRLIDYRLNDA